MREEMREEKRDLRAGPLQKNVASLRSSTGVETAHHARPWDVGTVDHLQRLMAWTAPSELNFVFGRQGYKKSCNLLAVSFPTKAQPIFGPLATNFQVL